jgi:hypothetical protein
MCSKAEHRSHKRLNNRVDVGRYKKKAPDQRLAFAAAQAIWLEAAQGLLSI